MQEKYFENIMNILRKKNYPVKYIALDWCLILYLIIIF